MIGSLLVARKNEKGAKEMGKVGTGLSSKDRRELLSRIKEVPSPPDSIRVPESQASKDLHFCEPEIIVQVRYSEVTGSGALRHPVFEGEREDLEPEQVLHWKSPDELIRAIVTSPGRELWPQVTKKDYAQYLLKYKSQIGPWLYGRPLTLFKCPKGTMDDSCFFSKHKGNMSGLKEIKIPMGDQEKEFYEVRNEEGLLYIARYSGVEFHVWNCASKDPWVAQEMVLDLDPGKGVQEADLIKAAFKVKAMLEAIGLKSFPKTTGKKGLSSALASCASV